MLIVINKLEENKNKFINKYTSYNKNIIIIVDIWRPYYVPSTIEYVV